MIDLNAFAVFPTVAIGILVAKLRSDGHKVSVLCPLAIGVPAPAREHTETALSQIARRIHHSTFPAFRFTRNLARSIRTKWLERPNKTVLKEVAYALEKMPDIILVSAYLNHNKSVFKIGKMAREKGIPLLIGGPVFNIGKAAEEWRKLPGVVAIVGGEYDHEISTLVETICTNGDLGGFAGLTLPDGNKTPSAPPLRNLNDVPIADYSDFPWEKYPIKVVPMMTGRGCQWDKCLFCNDVITVFGRTFRTRSIENVLIEIQEQAKRHETTNFFFLDLKLNSNPNMIRGIASEIQNLVPGAEWLGFVHVDLRKDNGLSRSDLAAAVAGGMKRISFGLESGSQRLLDSMNKGSSVKANSEFIKNAFEVGLSVRCTMIKGFPGETAEDMEKTAIFLEQHAAFLDRIRFNDFSLLCGTPIYEEIINNNEAFPHIEVTRLVSKMVRADYIDRQLEEKDYRKAKAKVLKIVHRINRRPVRENARQFDGLM